MESAYDAPEHRKLIAPPPCQQLSARLVRLPPRQQLSARPVRSPPPQQLKADEGNGEWRRGRPARDDRLEPSPDCEGKTHFHRKADGRLHVPPVVTFNRDQRPDPPPPHSVSL
ncbi:unnamed protein product [Gadus morhua 'NCC']